MITSNPREKKVIIIGASGFIGKTICEDFSNFNLNLLGLSSKDIDLTNTSEVNTLKSLLTKKTVLIIAAAKVREKGEDFEVFSQNILMAGSLAKILEKTQIKKCIFLSTIDVYGYPKNKITEQTSINPKTYYAISKYTSETILNIACNKSNTPLLILRFGGVFGPGQNFAKYGPNSFIYSLKKENKIKLWGDGEELRNFIYVKDLSKIITLLSFKKIEGIINISTNNSYTFENIVNILHKIHTKSFNVTRNKRTSVKFNQVLSNQKLKKILPKFEFIKLQKAILETYKSEN